MRVVIAVAVCVAQLLGASHASHELVPPLLNALLGPATDADLPHLRTWLLAKGAVLSGGTHAVSGSLRGLVATQAAPAGTVLVSVPLQATLSAATFSGAAQLRDAVAPDPELGLGPEEQPQLYTSTLVILYELLLAERSHWLPYLRTLPRSFPDLPALYEDVRPSDGSDRLWTQLGALASLVRQQREEMATLLPFVERAIQRLPHGRDALHRLPGPNATASLQHLAAWAWAVARTRTLDQPVNAFQNGAQLMPPGSLKAPTLMPYLDLANHEEPGRPGVSIEVASTGLGGSILFLASRDVAQGEELRFTYIDTLAEVERDPSLRDEGELCGDQWLSHYGFALQGGGPERDCFHVELTISRLRAVMPPSAKPPSTAMRSRLTRAGLDEKLHTVLDGSGTIYSGLLRWVAAAAGLPSVEDDTAWQEDAAVWGLLHSIMDEQRGHLQAALRQAKALGEESGGDGVMVRLVAAGALRGAQAALTTAEAAVAEYSGSSVRDDEL